MTLGHALCNGFSVENMQLSVSCIVYVYYRMILVFKSCSCWPAVLCGCTVEWHNAQTVNVNNITKN